MASQRSHELTNHSDIFACTYWGNFDAEHNSFIVASDIIQNRNRFIEDYAIQSVARNNAAARYTSFGMNGCFRKYFDHCELYRARNNISVLVVSPYKHVSADSQRFIDLCGFTEIYDLYSKHAITFVKVGKDKDFKDITALLN